MADMKPIYVRVIDSKVAFGLSRTTIYEMVKRGEIDIRKSGSASLLKVSEVEAALDASIHSKHRLGG